MATVTRRRASDVARAFRTHARQTKVLGDLGPWPWAWVAFGPGVGSPPVDFIDRPGEVLVRADLPGCARDDVRLTVEPGVLRLSGVRRADADARPGDSYHCVERWAGPFARTVRLPPGVDTAPLSVALEHGVLEVRLPKRAQATEQTAHVHNEEGAPAAESGDVVDAAMWGPTKTRFRPLHDRVLVERMEEEESRYGDIIIPTRLPGRVPAVDRVLA
jgi:HSP20 family molecular chaperone IbpA